MNLLISLLPILIQALPSIIAELRVLFASDPTSPQIPKLLDAIEALVGQGNTVSALINALQADGNREPTPDELAVINALFEKDRTLLDAAIQAASTTA